MESQQAIAINGGGGSPIKAWMKKHSPIKTRKESGFTKGNAQANRAVSNNHRTNTSHDKPLPAPPVANDGSPIRRVPGAPISGNVRAMALHLEGAEMKGKEPRKQKRSISALLKHKGSVDSAIPSNENKDEDRHHRHNKDPYENATRRKGSYDALTPGHANATRSPDNLNHLSARVETLEAQLIAARREIHDLHSADSSRQGHRSISAPLSDRQMVPARGGHWTADDEMLMRQEMLGRNGRYDGVVENLLFQRHADDHIPTLSPGRRTSSERRRHDSSARSSMDQSSTFRARAESITSSVRSNHGGRYGPAPTSPRRSAMPGNADPRSVSTSMVPDASSHSRSVSASSTSTIVANMSDAERARRQELRKLREQSWRQMQANIASASAGQKRQASDSLPTDPAELAEHASQQRPANRRKTSHDGEQKSLPPTPPEPITAARSDRISDQRLPRAVDAPVKRVPATDVWREDAERAAQRTEAAALEKEREKVRRAEAEAARRREELERVASEVDEDGELVDPGSNWEVVDDDPHDEEVEARAEHERRCSSPWRRGQMSPSRLEKVEEEFEWDEEVF